MFTNSGNIKTAFNEVIDVKIKSITSKDDGSYIINDSYIITEGDSIFNTKDDNIIMYSILNKYKTFQKLLGVTNEGYYVLKNIHRKEKKNYLDEHDIIKISKEIKRMHDIPPLDFLPKFETTELLIDKAQNINKNTLKKYINIISNLLAKEPLVISHNNLGKDSVLFGYDDLSIISLFNAALNIHQYDLASIILEYNLEGEEVDLFLKTYYGKKFTSLKKKKILLVKEIIQAIKKQDY